jgi:hypothetical protein
VCKGRTKDKGAVPVRVTREAVVRVGECEAELAGGLSGWEAMEARPGREGRIRAPGEEKVKGDFGVGKSGWVDEKRR